MVRFKLFMWMDNQTTDPSDLVAAYENKHNRDSIDNDVTPTTAGCVGTLNVSNCSEE